MTPEDAKIAFDIANGTANTLRGKIASAQKQLESGSEASAKIAAAILPGLERRLADAEANAASLQPLAAKRSFHRPTSPVVWNLRPDYPSEAELEAMEIPAFLRRAA